jgi:hypothetical protein
MSQSNPNKTEASIAASQIGRNEKIQGVAALAFIPVTDLTTFSGEFTITEGDLVFHFNRSPEVLAKPAAEREKYWRTTFPTCLEKVAKKVFECDYPRIAGQFIHEPDLGIIESWWFRASGFGHLLDPHRKAYDFVEELDKALDEASISQ